MNIKIFKNESFQFLSFSIVLLIIGLISLFSASYPTSYYQYGVSDYFIKRQLAFAFLGVISMAAANKIDYHIFKRFDIYLLSLSLFLLILVLIPGIGIKINGARRWINLFGLTTFQPSEICKLATIVFISSRILKDKISIFKYGSLLCFIAFLMMLEPHLSGTIIILLSSAIVLYVGGLDKKWFLFGLLLLALIFTLMLAGIITYGQNRIAIWLNPFSDSNNTGYQMVQSLLSIGTGGLWGVGIGNSRAKHLYLPECYNDFIFSIICEEIGFIGAVLLIILFLAFIITGFKISLHAKDKFGQLLSVGIISQFAIQIFLNMAVVTGLVPATGISLPLFSYGGTALAMQLFEIGIVLSVSKQSVWIDSIFIK